MDPGIVRRQSRRRKSCNKTATCPVDESSDEELNTKGVREVAYQLGV